MVTRREMKFTVGRDILCPLNKKDIVSRTTGRKVLSKKYRDSKSILGLCLRAKGIEMLSGLCDVTIIQGRRTDIDAYQKIILDAMQGVVFKNDSQVENLSIKKCSRHGKENIVTVIIKEVEKNGETN